MTGIHTEQLALRRNPHWPNVTNAASGSRAKGTEPGKLWNRAFRALLQFIPEAKIPRSSEELLVTGWVAQSHTAGVSRMGLDVHWRFMSPPGAGGGGRVYYHERE